MSLGKIFRLGGKLALLVAMTAFLLQSACTIGTIQLAAAHAGLSQSGCHESAPASPQLPDSGQKCCSGQHSPEVLLAAVSIAPAPLHSVEFVPDTLFRSGTFSHHAAETAFAPTGSPGTVVLRI